MPDSRSLPDRLSLTAHVWKKAHASAAARADLHKRQRDEERAEVERLRAEVLKIADWVERDRREPDKLLCHLLSLRRVAR